VIAMTKYEELYTYLFHTALANEYDMLYKYLSYATLWFVLIVIVLLLSMFAFLVYRSSKKK
jgi:cytochrome c biogenesis protein ResB